MSDNERQFTSRQLCGHCGNSVPLEIVATHIAINSDDDCTRSDLLNADGIVYELLSCPICEGVTLRSYYGDPQTSPSDDKFQLLYPATTEHPAVDSRTIRQPYSPPRRFRTIDADAYRVMLKRLAVIHECNRSKLV